MPSVTIETINIAVGPHKPCHIECQQQESSVKHFLLRAVVGGEDLFLEVAVKAIKVCVGFKRDKNGTVFGDRLAFGFDRGAGTV